MQLKNVLYLHIHLEFRKEFLLRFDPSQIEFGMGCSLFHLGYRYECAAHGVRLLPNLHAYMYATFAKCYKIVFQQFPLVHWTGVYVLFFKTTL